jgi:hypothetical protein
VFVRYNMPHADGGDGEDGVFQTQVVKGTSNPQVRPTLRRGRISAPMAKWATKGAAACQGVRD